MIETVLETKPIDFAPLTGTLSITIGAKALTGVGTSFLTQISSFGLPRSIAILGDTGQLRYMTVVAVADNTNATVEDNALETSAAKAGFFMTNNAPFFIVSDPKSQSGMPRNRIYNQGVNGDLDLKAVDGAFTINFNEGILIKSIYVRLPYQFTFADTNIGLKLQAGVGAAQVNLPSVGTNGSIFVSLENLEADVNAYVPPPESAVSGSTRWTLEGSFTKGIADPSVAPVNFDDEVPAVSNLSVPTVIPDDLVGAYLPVIIGVRIIHGFPLGVPA